MYHAMHSCCHVGMRVVTKFRLKYVCFGIGVFLLLDFFGAFTHMFEVSYDEKFVYPYEGDVHEFVMALKHKEKPAVNPINEYNYSFIIDNKQKCMEPGYSTFRIVYVVKSAMENAHRRAAIRNSWGFEKRFFDVPSRTVFLLGVHPDDEELQAKVKAEAAKHNDIIQANFIDSYYNNTIKTMMGFNWILKHCSNSKFYMFVDDDIYVSVKNVLRFIRNPANYPDYLKEPKKFGAHKREVKQPVGDNLYVTNAMAEIGTPKLRSSIHNNTSIVPVSSNTRPMTKVAISEDQLQNSSRIENNMVVFKYKLNSVGVDSTRNSIQQSDMYNKNASVLNRTKRQIFDFELPEDVRLFAGFVFVSSPHRHKSSKWYVSLDEYPYHLWPPYVTAGAYILSKEAFVDMYYTSLYTKHFQFDDIFLGLVAKKADVEPFHCEEFHFYKKEYTKFNYKYVITSHGYGDPNELLHVWNEQKALGNA